MPTGKGHRLGGGEPDQQRADQTRAAGNRHPLDGSRGGRRLFQGLVDHRRNRLQMLARGNLRHHTAVTGMDIDLGGDDIGQDLAAVADDGGGSFVTGVSMQRTSMSAKEAHMQ